VLDVGAGGVMHNYDLSGARVGGPLAEWAAGFSAYLTGRGYAASTVRQHLGLMADLSAWLGERRLWVGQLSPAMLDGFVLVMRGRRTHLLSALALAPLLGYLAKRGGVLPEFPPDRPVDARAVLLREYQGYLRAERNLGEATIRNYLLYAAGFLAGVDDPVEAGLASLCGAQVLGIVSVQLRRHPPRSASAVMNADRALLRFLYLTGRIPRPLAQVVPAAARRPSRLPESLDASMVAALLDSCDRSTEMGRRDYAVLMLLRRYGPRGIEVSRLELADVRWRAGEIVIHGKGGRTDVLPLMHDAGQAVAEYLLLRRSAPRGVRAVFLTGYAPTRPLHRQSVYGIAARACARAGVVAVGPRAFRHALGCDLLAAGASLVEIRDVLRHRNITTTALYARADLAALTILVRPWPISQRQETS
jgi:site-specific recombinase XerD